jgi:hypothetical protein
MEIKINETASFPVVFYEYETLSLVLREEHRHKACENRVLRGVSGPNMDGIAGGSRKLHNEKPLNLYSLPNVIRMIK